MTATGAATALYPVTIPGPRLTLREVTADDFDGLFALEGDERVCYHLSYDTKGAEAVQARLEDAIARAKLPNRPDYYLASTETAGGQMVGVVRLGLTGIRAVDLGYSVRYDRWGRGYATEGSRMAIDFAFGTLGLHRVMAGIGPDNGASQRVVEHLGMQYEGRIRDHVFTNGAWRDSLTYSVLEHEWPPHGAGM